MRVGYPIALAAAALVVTLLLTGCGGGGGEQDNQSQGSGQGQATGKKSDKKGERRPVRGIVAKTLPDKRTIVLRPKDKDALVLRYNPESLKVTLDGKEATPEAIEEGQRARVAYVEFKTKRDQEVNVARSIRLRSAGSEPGGETTG